MTDATHRTALVTGASRGVGRAIAERLAADGVFVAVHYARQDAAAQETVAAIEKAGGRAFAVRAELGVDGDIDTLFTGLEEGLRGQPLDILVNNAGVAVPKSIDEITPEEFDHMLAVNVRAPFLIIRRALPLLRDGGRVINISSGATRIALREHAYAVTKGALDTMTRTLTMTLGARSITVNTVAPGITETDMNPWLRDNPEAAAAVAGVTALGRTGRPADIADVVAFLASDDARWVTGQWLDATGGLYLGPGGFRP
ncbi:SDR family oxidoreductase [Streptomyces sp. NPDC098781]|uniref:SDR family oxidoreductase n=1 Tax=Streptomyces sp. NPDC098781 TaxID=3366097 RepID=UPI0037FE98B8